jgi:hypothetical protein
MVGSYGVTNWKENLYKESFMDKFKKAFPSLFGGTERLMADIWVFGVLS